MGFFDVNFRNSLYILDINLLPGTMYPSDHFKTPDILSLHVPPNPLFWQITLGMSSLALVILPGKQMTSFFKSCFILVFLYDGYLMWLTDSLCPVGQWWLNLCSCCVLIVCMLFHWD